MIENYLNKVSDKVSPWTLISFLTFVIGYIGFFTFCSINNIPYNTPSIFIVIGIGLLNIIYWVLIYIGSENNPGLRAVQAIVTYGLMVWFTMSPISWAIISVIFLLVYSEGYWSSFNFRKNKPKDSKKDKEKKSILQNSKFIMFIDISAIFLALLVHLFVTTSILAFILVSLYLLHEMNYVRQKKKFKLYQLVVVLIVVPTFLSYNVLNKVSFTLFGISKNKIELQDIKGKTQEYILVYQDQENLYLKDSLNASYTTVIPKSEVTKLITLDKLKLESTTKKGLLDGLWNNSNKEEAVDFPIDNDQTEEK